MSTDPSPINNSENRRHTRAKGPISDLLRVQWSNFEYLTRINNAESRLKPESASLILLESRFTLTKELWNEIRNTHLAYQDGLTNVEIENAPYFIQDEYGQHEELYFQLLDNLSSVAAHVLAQPWAVSAAANHTHAST